VIAPRLNVDEKDIEHFSNYADDWWNPEGSWKVLHTMNQVRIPFIRDGFLSPGVKVKQQVESNANVFKGLKILDVGCGAGLLSEAVAKLGAEVVALDPAENLIEAANSHLATQKNLKLTYSTDLVQDHAAKNKENYDIVVASEVVEHVVDKKHFLEACVSALKPGGSIYVTTLNKTWSSWFFGIICAEFIFRLLPMNTHIWDQFISPEDVAEILKEINCKTMRVQGWANEFYRNKFSYQDSTHIMYGLHAVKNRQ
jgi:polyprenyldihydroxybenzoate methyltransferase / 3-demethylubiquinol 3-O-methyltransferase